MSRGLYVGAPKLLCQVQQQIMLFVLLSRVNMVLLPMVAGLGGQCVIVQDIIYS